MRRAILVQVLLIGVLILAGLKVESVSESPSVSVTAYFNKGGDDLRTVIRSAIFRNSGPVEIAMYDFTDRSLAGTIMQLVQSRSVKLLVSSEGGGSQLESAICSAIGAAPYGEGYVMRDMHHKFAVIGGQLVITGSANWTPNSLDTEANNVVIIESAEIARAYHDEFQRLIRKGTVRKCR